MPPDHPQTPQSPSQQTSPRPEFSSKSITSPRSAHSLPTPAHSVNGSMSSTGSAADGFHEDISNKRKRDVDDHGDREQKKVHVENSRISIEDLHLDVGAKYLLCRTQHRPYPVPVTRDLLQEYGLTDIAASVARVGEGGAKKIVRKTYKNYMRALSGAFGSVKKEDGAPDTMLSMMMIPQREWDARVGRETRLEVAGPGAPEVPIPNHDPLLELGPLLQSMQMAKGGIPKKVWNPSVLGELNHTATPPTGAKTALIAPLPQPTGGALGRAVKGEVPRPKRNIKKRQYGDSSFEGYGEGYVDDDTGYSTGNGDDHERGRKRPKKNNVGNHFQGPARQSSYGPGMVGA